MSMVLDEHREYLSDRHRLDAYRRAIEALVRPGCVVVDLGSGSGILGLMACRAGAARVYCIEASALIGLTREIFRSNGFADRVTFIKDVSTFAAVPEKADLVVADQIGRFGFDAGIFAFFADAHARFLKPGGSLLPSRVDLHVAPVEHEELWDRVEFWNGSPAEFDFGAARRIAVNTGYPVKFQPRHLLAAPATVASLDTGRCPASISGTPATLTVEKAGIVHGIGAWFSAELAPQILLSNGPLDPASINRRNIFFPIDRPVAVNAGDTVRVRLTIRPHDLIVAWNVEICAGGAGAIHGARSVRFAHSTFQGMLICQEDLERAQPQYVPTLTPRGEARRSILELCDGHRPLEAIEREVYRRHPQLFATPAEAAAFAAEVISIYTR